MIDSTQPTGFIDKQTLKSSPIPISKTLVDDPVALVDDPVALVGSQTTPIAIIRVSVDSNAPKGFIHRRR